MKRFPLYSALTYLSESYGIELDEDTFETYAMSAYRKIGNKEIILKVIRVVPEKDPNRGWFIQKPCDMEEIEAITLDWEPGREVSATDNYLAYRTIPIENWIERFKRNKDEFYLSGTFIKYAEFQDKILLSEDYPAVNILYKAQATDEEGLPFITEKEMEAIAAYCAYAYDLKRGRVQKDQATLQLSQIEYSMWSKLCSEARVADSLSQNEINEILDVLTSFDIHSYNVSSTKPIK